MSTAAGNSSRPPANSGLIAYRVYCFFLRAYPKEFRHEYGPLMAQLFRDCLRAESLRGSRIGVPCLLARMLLDIAQSVPKQHLGSIAKENSIMNNLRQDALAVCGCMGIIIIAALLLSYVRTQQVPSILMLGFVPDALVIAGILGNLIVFVLVKTTKSNPLRAALWTFVGVTLLLVIVSAIIGGVNDPRFSFAGVLIGYVVSFLFWFGLHWVWAQRKHSTQTAVVK